MTLAERLKVSIVEAYQLITVSYDKASHLPQFNQFHESIKLLALVAKTTIVIRHLFIIIGLIPWLSRYTHSFVHFHYRPQMLSLFHTLCIIPHNLSFC